MADESYEDVLDIHMEESPMQAHFENNADLPSEEDDDFGSFDDASIEELEAAAPHPKEGEFSSLVFQNPELFDQKLQTVMDSVFPQADTYVITESQLLSESAAKHLEIFSRTPRLHPPNWTKLKTRHSLLIRLGVPINLDELESGTSGLGPKSAVGHTRKRSVSEHDIDWSNFDIPEFASLQISGETKEELLGKSGEVLSEIEEHNLNNTSRPFLETSSGSSLDAKLQQMKDNHKRLIELSSVWQEQIRELRNSQEIYESVVQNMVGYSQKLRRNEILEHLKLKKGKRAF